jgi:ATP-binding cassette subfamily F protein uup
VRDFSTTIQRGDKVGIIGPNGSGKTTLLRILMGDLAPQQGNLEHGTNLEVAYFDQLRAQLDDSKSILENVGQGGDTVTINGRTRNLIGYLEDFLFTRDRVHAPISALSGGERNRLLLARMFARPANLLVMDEPTNDLDIESLEILEDLLLDFTGTLLLVSHDRSFLNNLVTSTLVLDGNGQVNEYIGGYDDWQRQSQEVFQTLPTSLTHKAGVSPAQRVGAVSLLSDSSSLPAPASIDPPRKLSYKEQRELESQKRELAELPQRIENLEAEQHQLSAAMADPAFYQRGSAEITRDAARLKELEDELSQTYQRWETLEKL